VDDQDRNGMVFNGVEQTGRATRVDKLSIPDDTQFRVGLAALPGLLPAILLMMVCFAAIGLVFWGPEQTVVGALIPGSQEWLHYRFFHLSDVNRRS